MVRDRLNVAFLILAALSTLGYLVSDAEFLRYPGLLLLAGYLLTVMGLSVLARLLLLVAVMVTAWAFYHNALSWTDFLMAADRFAFFATFIVALGLLRIPAYRSRLVHQCGTTMLRQPPRRRYPILSAGSALFGIVINIGVLNLFSAMIDKSNTLKAADNRPWVQKVRRRRMTLALLRGFSLAPLISPMGIGVAVILSSMPQLAWRELVPLGWGAALLIYLLGWLVDTITGPQPSASARSSHHAPSLLPIATFVLFMLSIVMLVFALVWLLDIRLPIAALVGAPLAAIGWLVWQNRGLKSYGWLPTARILRRRLPWLLRPVGNEVVVLGAAGYIAVLTLALIDGETMLSLLGFMLDWGVWNAVFAMLLVFGLAQMGINPILTVTLLASLLPQLNVPGLSEAAIGVALLTGWTLALMSSPLTASMLIMSRLSGVSSIVIGYVWNRTFLLLAVPALAAWFVLAHGFFSRVGYLAG